MISSTSPLDSLPEWRSLTDHAAEQLPRDLRQLFAEDTSRVETLHADAGNLHIDYSKQRVTSETLTQLVDLARARHIEDWREAMFRGDAINTTEHRAVLHTALRHQTDEPIYVDGENVMPLIRHEHEHMAHFSESVRHGEWTGYTGRPIRHIVNIGIGGSDLGPHMVCEALKAYSQRNLTMHFVSNIDGTHLAETLRDLDASETLFIIASKTFTTDETMTNAASARAWIAARLGTDDAIAHHFVAVSTNAPAVEAFGIQPDNMFLFWDWVGGRYSLGSAIGLSIMLSVGPENFKEILRGMNDIDEHFRSAPLEKNAPVILALLSIWNTNFIGSTTEAILPYEQYLHRFPAYLQQAAMESNGKSVTRDGESFSYATSPIIWGEPGTNGQHAFYQLIHQGTTVVPCDFIAFARPLNDPDGQHTHHRKLIANVIAQSRALAFGRTADELRNLGESEELIPHKTFAGNRPSTTIFAPQLTPRTLGQLIALYEHKIFVQGIIWGIDSFDQWGVELGKTIAKDIYHDLTSENPTTYDQSTDSLISWWRSQRL